MDPTSPIVADALAAFGEGSLRAREVVTTPTNYTGPLTPRTDIGPATADAQVAIAVVMMLLVFLRLYTRHFVSNAFGADDVFIFAGAITSVALVAIHYELVYTHGIGIHMELYRKEYWGHFMYALKYLYFSQVIQSVALLLVKASVLIFFRRIIQFGKTRTLLNVVTWIVVSFALVYFFFSVFQCYPPSVYWTEASKARVQPKQCIKDRIYIMNQIFPAFNAVTDLLIWLLPIPAVMKVQMGKRDKAIVIGLLCVGAGAVSSSIARTILHRLNNVKLQPMQAAAPLSFLTALEPLLAIICASLFTLRPLTHHLRNKFKKIYSSSNMSAPDDASQSSSKDFRRAEPIDRKRGPSPSIDEVEEGLPNTFRGEKN